MPPSRLQPRVGMVAYAGDAPEPLIVVAVDGARLVACGPDGGERAFRVHRLTGHWVLDGDPYWGLRLRLTTEDDGTG